MSTISLIAAVACGGVIGQDGKIPWHLPDDLKRFRELTRGHAVIMGRKTHESIVAAIGMPLPKRLNIVLSRRLYYARGCMTTQSFGDAVALAETTYGSDTEIFVIGGAEIYALALPQAHRFYLTEVNAVTAPCNGEKVYFPLWDTVANDRHAAVRWRDAVPPEHHPHDGGKHLLDFTFRTLERVL